MKLHLGLFIALCAVVVGIQSMEPDDSVPFNGKDEILYRECERALESKILTQLSEKPADSLVDRLAFHNYSDLLEQHLKFVPVDETNLVAYGHALIAAASKNNFESIAVLLKHNIPANVCINDDTPLSILTHAFVVNGFTTNPLRSVKLLLAHGANPNIVAHQSNPLAMLAKNMSIKRKRSRDQVKPLFDQFIQLLMLSGANSQKMIDLPYYRADYDPEFQAFLYGNCDLRTTMEECVKDRVQLLKDVKYRICVWPTGCGLQSRRHFKDTEGNNLLFHALFYYNQFVANYLLKLWPQMLCEPNFKRHNMLDNDQVRANFFHLIGWTNFTQGLQDRIAELRAANQRKFIGI